VVEAGKTLLAVLETGGADLLDARSLTQAEAQVNAAGAALEARARSRNAPAPPRRWRARSSPACASCSRSRALSKQEFDVAQAREIGATQDERTAAFNLQIAEFELAQAARCSCAAGPTVTPLHWRSSRR